MKRIDIQFTEKQHRKLMRWAGRRGMSLAEAVRHCVDEHLGAEAVFGKYADPEGRSSVGRGHDAWLSEAYRE